MVTPCSSSMRPPSSYHTPLTVATLLRTPAGLSWRARRRLPTEKGKKPIACRGGGRHCQRLGEQVPGDRGMSKRWCYSQQSRRQIGGNGAIDRTGLRNVPAMQDHLDCSDIDNDVGW